MKGTTFNGLPVILERYTRYNLIGQMTLLVETHYDRPPVASLNWARARGVWFRWPPCRARNSWRWICLRFGPSRPVHVVRFTLP